MTQVDAQQRNTRTPHQFCGAQDRTVPAQDDSQFRFRSFFIWPQPAHHGPLGGECLFQNGVGIARAGMAVYHDGQNISGGQQLDYVDGRVNCFRAAGVNYYEYLTVIHRLGPSATARSIATRSASSDKYGLSGALRSPAVGAVAPAAAVSTAPATAAAAADGAAGPVVATFTSHKKYSTLPLGPGSGLATTSFTAKPSPWAHSATLKTDSTRNCGDLTTPPDPSRSRPTSNCGLTINSKSAPGAAHCAKAGNTVFNEIKDKSETTISGASAKSCGSKARIFVRSMTVTRLSCCSAHANCP